MNVETHEILEISNPLKTQEASHKNPEEPPPEKEESLQAPPPTAPLLPRELLSIKKWSENKQRYFYKPKDPEYARNHYRKHKRDLVCTCCGAIVQTAMFRHVKTLKCLNVKDRVQKALNERAEATQPAETQ